MPSNIRLARMNYNGSAQGSRSPSSLAVVRARHIRSERETTRSERTPRAHTYSLPRLCAIVVCVREKEREEEREKPRIWALRPDDRRSPWHAGPATKITRGVACTAVLTSCRSHTVRALTVSSLSSRCRRVVLIIVIIFAIAT